MSDYKHLGARKYFDLRYSLIPDNIIKQVIGTYTKTTYTTQHSYETDTIDQCEITFKDGSTGATQIEFISPYTKDDYANVYREEVTYNESGYYRHITRTEKVAVRIIVNVYDELPMEFINDEYALTFNDVDAKTYDRASGSLPLPPLDPDEDQWWYIDNNPDILWGPYNYNQPTAIGTGSRTESESSDVPLKSVTVDSYYNGKVIDVDTNLYRLKLEVEFYALKTEFNFQEAYNGVTGSMSMLLVKSFKLAVNYYVATTEDVDFDIHTADADYAQYPLKVTGNQYTSNETTFYQDHTDVPWYQYISNLILNKYSKGKTFINSKIKASYLIDNSLDIDGEVIIKDIDNKYISREESGIVYTSIFKLKNIEYNYSGGEFYANVILLEDRQEHLFVETGFINYIVLDLAQVSAYSINTISISIESSIANFASKFTINLEDKFYFTLLPWCLITDQDIYVDALTVAPIETHDCIFVEDGNPNAKTVDNAIINIVDGNTIVTYKNNSQVIETARSGFKDCYGYQESVKSFSIDNKPTGFKDSYGYYEKNKATVVNTKNTAFKDAYGYWELIDAYSFTKIDTSFKTYYGYYTSDPIAVSADIKASGLLDSIGYYESVLAYNIQMIDTWLLTNTLIACMYCSIVFRDLIDIDIIDYIFGLESEHVSIDTKEAVSASTVSSIAYDSYVRLRLKASRPINDRYFFNIPIEDWNDFTIEEMMETYLD